MDKSNKITRTGILSRNRESESETATQCAVLRLSELVRECNRLIEDVNNPTCDAFYLLSHRFESYVSEARKAFLSLVSARASERAHSVALEAKMLDEQDAQQG